MRFPFYLYGWLYGSSIDFLLKNIRRNMALYSHRYSLFPLLDMCCGTGAQCRLLAEYHNQIIGLDLDLKMLIYASFKSPRLPFVCSDASSSPFKDMIFKGIIISYALHEKLPEIRQKMISEARKLIMPGGKIIFLDYDPPWNLKSRLARVYISLIERGGGTDHFHRFNDFLGQGGLTGFLGREKFRKIERYDIDWASSRIFLAEFD